MTRVCFVCLGNICRSPTAEGVFQELVNRAGLQTSFSIDSAGTAAYHSGELADARSRQEAEGRGVPIRSVARQFLSADFARFEYVIAMDRANLMELQRLPGARQFTGTLALFRAFDPGSDIHNRAQSDVPDPYYGGVDGFATVFELCEASARGLLDHIQRERPELSR
jgi:protein-tyrosine phosphatase